MEIKETNAQIEAWIQDEIRTHFYSSLNKAQKEIEVRIRDIVLASIRNQPEYTSLVQGRLKGEFGLTDANDKLDAILRAWGQNIVTQNKRKAFTIEMIQYDFRNVLALPEAQQITEKLQKLDWLDWLLIQGDKTIIRQYSVEMTTGQNSRTGMAVMKKTGKGKWSVPSQYSGTVSNNWVARAIDDISDTQIENIVLGEMSKYW